MRKVIIEVLGGVVSVSSMPKGIGLEIIDFDVGKTTLYRDCICHEVRKNG